MTLVISEALHRELQAHLEDAFPNEGGGFLIGEVNGGRRTITETRFVENVFETEEQYHRYLMELSASGPYAQAEDYADEHGLSLVGYFHSHPNHPAIPSEFDREYAIDNFIYLIVSVQEGRAAESRAWILEENRGNFNAVDLYVS